MSSLWIAIKKRYYAEYLEDKAYLLNVYDDFKSWHISLESYVTNNSLKELLYLLFRIIKGLVVKVAFWWPFSIMTYIWNLLIKYSFIPLQEILYYYADKNGNTVKWQKITLYFNYFILFLRTIGGLTLLVAKILNFWHVTRWDYLARYERFELREDDIVVLINGWLAKLAPIGMARRRTKRFIIDKLILKPWYIAKLWLNPKKYWVFRLFYYKKGRQLIYNLFYVYITFPIWVYYRITLAVVKHKIRIFLRITIKRYYRNLCFVLTFIKLLLNPKLIAAMVQWRFWRTIYLILKAVLYVINGLTIVCLVVALPFVELYICVLYFFFLKRGLQIGYFHFRDMWYNVKYFFEDAELKEKKKKQQKEKEIKASQEQAALEKELNSLQELIKKVRNENAAKASQEQAALEKELNSLQELIKKVRNEKATKKP
jgi:hypothetical protein